jgi:hypothetical protein
VLFKSSGTPSGSNVVFFIIDWPEVHLMPEYVSGNWYPEEERGRFTRGCETAHQFFFEDSRTFHEEYEDFHYCVSCCSGYLRNHSSGTELCSE